MEFFGDTATDDLKETNVLAKTIHHFVYFDLGVADARQFSRKRKENSVRNVARL